MMDTQSLTPVVEVGGTDWTQVAGAIGIFTLLTVIVWQLAATRRAKTLLVREQEYRRMAEEGIATQQRIERQLDELGGRLADVQARMDSMERILQQVE
ncbi:hypothetical protein [Nonomuraea angiospora]